jgi:lipopolysaccharide/colanic/teichoic acid biosynthesis glycosyltransferase
VIADGLPPVVDKFISIGGLVTCWPLLAFVAAAVKASSPGPIFFRQQRMGRFGKPFTLLKFRTMTVNDQGPQVTAHGDARVTLVGRVLRALKLDELPELLNVLRGEMALVGPRPEVPRYVKLDDPLWQQVLAARPGITDPVTVRLRNEEALLAEAGGGDHERFYTDVLQPWKLRGYIDYLKRRSLSVDLGVLRDTLLAVLHPASVKSPSLEEIKGRP